jgi:methylated-DNA-[protein]-cysteine S-methyltransferase
MSALTANSITLSYTRLASMAAHAVGGAIAHNRISILIPCHRVVRYNGHLTGYAGGLDRKAELLRFEKQT